MLCWIRSVNRVDGLEHAEDGRPGKGETYVKSRISVWMQKASVLALVLVLALASVAYASPETTPTPDPGTPSPAPAPEPDPEPDPAPDNTNRTPPTPSDDPASPDVDDVTEEFRGELARKQAELDAFKAQLDELDRELALAAEAYNAAVERLNDTRQQVSETEADLHDASEAYEFQQSLLDDRANSMYRQGTFAGIELLLEAKSVSDFVARVKFLNTIGLADAEVAEGLKGQKALVEQKAVDLEESEKQAEAIEFELRARQIEVMLRIQERQEMLANAQQELLDMLADEAERRSAAESVLLRQVLAGANDAGIEVIPGTPVETAFAYHGIPYLWGGETTSGFDCSGLLLYVFRQHGVNLPHYSGSQFLLGTKVAPAELLPGDAVFFGSPIHHVGMYVGGGYFIHAPRTGDFVKLSKLADRRDYAGARRYDWEPRIGPPEGL
jgi:cell wall-associated NlpC family hydrolase